MKGKCFQCGVIPLSRLSGCHAQGFILFRNKVIHHKDPPTLPIQAGAAYVLTQGFNVDSSVASLKSRGKSGSLSVTNFPVTAASHLVDFQAKS